MRKITQKAVEYMRAMKPMRQGNTVVYVDLHSGYALLRLHGNPIAQASNHGTVWITIAGWNTPTTLERLRGVLSYFNTGVTLTKVKGQLYLNGKPWDGSATNVKQWVIPKPTHTT